jgi:hypothetical protein
MKTWLQHGFLPLAGVCLLCARGSAQEFELIESSFTPATIAAGGEFEVAIQSCTLPVGSDPPQGGEFSLLGPPILVPEQEGGEPPALLVGRLPGGAVQIAWDAPAAGFVLESSSDLRNWVVESEGSLTGAGALTVSTAEPGRYYRLRR